MNTDLLLHRIIKGDNEAFATLYRSYVDKLFGYGRGLGFDENICLDAIQDIFCKIYTNHSELSHVQNISYYLFRSFKNRLIDISRKNKTEELSSEHEPNFDSEISVLETIIDEEERLILQQQVKSLLDNLTANQREVIYLRYMQEMEYDEIAGLMNITPESARKLVYRAMTKMRAQSGLTTGLMLLILRELL